MVKKKMAIKFFSPGACGEVAGSKYFLDIDDRLLQIDCGMFQGGITEVEEFIRKFHE